MKTTTLTPISLFFSVVLLLFSASVASAAVSPEHEVAISKGNARIDDRAYDEAIAIFRDILKSSPDDQKARLMLGIALNRKGDLKEAEAVLKEVANRQYELSRTYYELGVLCYNKGDYSASREYFRRAEQSSKDLTINSSTAGFVSDMDRREHTKKYTLQATVGLQYDSNVTLSPSRDSALFDSKDNEGADIRMVIFLKGAAILTNAPVRTEAAYSFYQGLNSQISAFNVQNHEVELKAEFSPLRHMAFEAKYLLDYTILGGDGYSLVHTVSPAVRLIVIRDNMPTRLVYTYAKKNFYSVSTIDNNIHRSGDYHSFGIEQKFAATNDLIFTLGYLYDSNNTEEEVSSYNGNKFTAAVEYNHQSKWLTGAKFEYHNKNYGNYQQQPWMTPEPRSDIQRTFNIFWTRPISPVFSVSIDQTFIVNDSTLSSSSYERSVTGIFLTARF